jgi:hypothetical protein
VLVTAPRQVYLKTLIEGDTEHGLVLMGQVASGVHELVSVADFVPAMAREAAELLLLLPAATAPRRTTGRVREPR